MSISNQNQECWVIKNKGGYYVNADFRALFTGRTSGFVGYDNRMEAEKDLERLGGEREGYNCKQVNLNDVPRGKRVYT